jgi:hypothetical protein
MINQRGSDGFGGKTISFTVDGYAAGTAKWWWGGTSNVDLEARSGRTRLPYIDSSNLVTNDLPHAFIGTAFLDCGLAPVGTRVSAWVDGEIVGTSWVENIESGSVIPCRTTSNQSSPCEVFDNVIQQDNLVAVWRFSNADYSWSFYVPDDAFYGINNLTTRAGDIVWVNVTAEQAFQSTTLYSGWNLISLD